MEAFDCAGIVGLHGRQHLDCYRPTHDPMGTKVDGAHTAGAERLENGIFPAENEVAPTTAEYLIGLEPCKQAFRNQGVGHRRGCVWYVRDMGREVVVKALWLDDVALAHAIQEVRNKGRRRHRLLGVQTGWIGFKRIK